MASYPTTIPDLVALIVQGMPIENLITVVDELHAALVTLGTNPQGAAGTVANRFAQFNIPTAPQNITAISNQIAANALVVQISNTSAGSLTLTSTPTIADGSDGQTLTILHVSGPMIGLQSGTSFNLKFNATDAPSNIIQMFPGSVLDLVYSASLGMWMERAFSVNT